MSHRFANVVLGEQQAEKAATFADQILGKPTDEPIEIIKPFVRRLTEAATTLTEGVKGVGKFIGAAGELEVQRQRIKRGEDVSLEEIGEVSKRGLSGFANAVLGIPAAPFEAGLGVIAGAPAEILSRTAGFSPERSRQIGTGAEVVTALLPGASRLLKKTLLSLYKSKPAKAATIELTESMGEQLGLGLGKGARAEARASTALKETGDLTADVLKASLSARIVKAAGELFEAGKVPRDPKMLISDQITGMLAEGKISDVVLDEILKRNNVGFVDLANTLFRPSISDAARRMQALSVAERRLKLLAVRSGPEAAAEMAVLNKLATELDVGGIAKRLWRRLDNVRRGLLVSQLSTSARNAEVQGARVTLEVFEEAIDATLQRLMGVTAKTGPLDGLETLISLFAKGNKADVDKILKELPSQYDRLFGTYVSDISRRMQRGDIGVKLVDKSFEKAEDAVAILNTANRFQEFTIRRAVFRTKLSQSLERQGLNLDKILAENQVGKIPLSSISEAIDTSLVFTFAEVPKFGTVWHSIVKAVNDIPGVTFALPFPRFMFNSTKYLFERSPAGFLKLLTKNERNKIANGDVKTLTKAMVGSLMLGLAIQARRSEFAEGTKWYHMTLPDELPAFALKLGAKPGQTVDIRPFNPFAAYFFVADIVVRKERGTLNDLSGSDIIQGILSSNLRAGAGLFLVDKLINTLAGVGTAKDVAKVQRGLKELSGEIVAGFLTPLQQIQDVYSGLSDDPEDKFVRGRRGQPFLGPILTKIPGLSRQLDKVFIPTQKDPLVKEAPLLKQATGILLGTKKNPIQRELQRLDFARREVLQSTGDVDLDQLMAKKMGAIVEALMVPLIDTKFYRELKSDNAKAVVLKASLAEIRTEVRKDIIETRPDLAEKIQLDRLGRRERRLLEEILDKRRGKR